MNKLEKLEQDVKDNYGSALAAKNAYDAREVASQVAYEVAYAEYDAAYAQYDAAYKVSELAESALDVAYEVACDDAVYGDNYGSALAARDDARDALDDAVAVAKDAFELATKALNEYLEG